MDPIEEEIRISLGEREKQKFESYTSKHPEFQDYLQKAREAYESYVNNSVSTELSKISEGMTEEEMKDVTETVGEIVNPALREVSKVLSYETLLKLMSNSYSESTKTRIAENKLLFKQYRRTLEEMDSEGFLDLEKGRKLLDELAETSAVHDVFVDSLTKKAKQKGIDYALKESTINETWKEIFPNKEELKNYRESSFNKKIVPDAKSENMFNSLKFFLALGMYSDISEKKSKVLDASFQSFFSGFNEFIKVLQPALKDMHEEAIRRIYG